jgi:hypothetical protein
MGDALFLILEYLLPLTNSKIATTENRWMERNKPFLPRDSRSPGTILANYCAEMGFEDTQVEDELDWDYLAVNSVVDDNLE